MTVRFSCFTIYFMPKDAVERGYSFAVRRWDIVEERHEPQPSNVAFYANTIGVARGAVPGGSGLWRHPRYPGVDDDTVLETWI